MIWTTLLRRLEHALLPGWRVLRPAPGGAIAGLTEEHATAGDAAERSWGHVRFSNLSVLFGVH